MAKSPFEDIQFPQYRKYSNNKNYFMILSLSEFIEVQIIGTRQIRTHIIASQFPEKNHIIDLLLFKQPNIVAMEPNEFNFSI